jgi:hypothetical protein
MAKELMAMIWEKETEVETNFMMQAFLSGVEGEGLIVLAGAAQVLSPRLRHVSFLFTRPQGG